ncbi:MAG TPA: ABC transporter ATP-binding protein [Methylococcaceae bacterium]|nr:ABC transporter ATP-binding protein [Methylococcaceae bacterium]
MSNDLITVDRVSKKFFRSLQSSVLYGLQDIFRKALRLKPREQLSKHEFWALRDISFSVRRGECLGVIGPNGAGKSTLLKLINRDYRADRGGIVTMGPIKSLIQIGTGLQPLLSGRENIYIQCAQLGLNKRDTDAKLEAIVAFAELEEFIDAPVKTYSNGMYARLEFAIATCVPVDILLIDEVLAVGDIAFQLRSLERLNQLKQDGAAIVFVSHSEMNVRQIADRCLLLFNGRQIALGDSDALFCKYYESIGYLNRHLKPLGALMDPPADFTGEVAIKSLQLAGRAGNESTTRTGEALELILEYEVKADIDSAALVVQFRNTAGVLVGAIDSRLVKTQFRLRRGCGQIRLSTPFLGLTPGIYRVAAGFMRDHRQLAFTGRLLDMHVVQKEDFSAYGGLIMLDARFEQTG